MKLSYITPQGLNFSTGYFDANILSSDHKYLLCVQNTDNFSLDFRANGTSLCVIDILEDKIIKLASLNCFNFQQGARANFIHTNNNEKIIFNNYSPDIGYHSVILQSFSESNSTILPWPVYTFSKAFNAVATLDFRRHDLLKRGYSYGHFVENDKNLLNYRHDQGLRIFNYPDLTLIRNIKLEELPTFKKINNQYLDHPMLNPSGTRLAFYHRIKCTNEIISYLYVYDLLKNKLNFVRRLERGTHFNWCDNSNLLIWGSMGTIFTSIRKILPIVLRNE